MAKKAVSRASVNIAKGLVKDVTLMKRYVGQEPEPADAVELLEECIEAGSKRLRAGAFPLLAERDLERAEQWSEDTMQYFRSPSVWRNPLAADVMMKAVEHASITYNEQGHRRIAGYLDSLHAAGRAEHLPALEKLARHVASITDGSRAAAAWFGQAITAIRQRT